MSMNEEKTNEPSIVTMQSGGKAEKSIFDAIPSKTSFFAGLIAGIMAFSTIGFILVLVGGADLSKLGLAGNGVSGWNVKKPAGANANANANTNAPAGIRIEGASPSVRD